MDVKETISVIKHNKNLTNEELMKIKSDILEFLESDAPQEEKELFYPFGYLEMVDMLLDDSED